MKRNNNRALAVFSIVVACILLSVSYAGCLGSNNETDGTGAIPPEIEAYSMDWPMANKDYNNTRSTSAPDSIINSCNVGTLGLAWTCNLKAGAATNPIIVGDDIYFQDLKGNVAEIDLSTGIVKWAKFYNSSGILGPNGPAVGYGMVFVHKDLYNITALNRTSGKELWSTELSFVPSTGIDIQPTVYDGMVYTSTVPGTGDVFYKPGGIGVIYALDAKTGEVKWNFSTVKDSSLWGHPDVNSGGGCWYPPSIDTSTGLMYWGVGNPAPFAGAPGYPSGSSFDDSPLYSDCLLAIDHSNGNLEYYSQTLAHDIWDHDFQISPILASGYVNGINQDIVLGSGKMGIVYAFNRTTGAIQWETPVGTHFNDTLDPITGPTWVAPGVLGGVETPMAYSDGIVYVPVVNLPLEYIPTGINISTFDVSKGTGELVAINVNTGHIIWQKDFPSINVGAATVVNDVVFTATYDGVIHAFHAKTGDKLFEYQAPAGINAWPAVAGDTIVWPCGVGGTPSLIALRVGMQQGPTLSITSPQDGASVTGTSVDVSVAVNNFDIVDKIGQANAAGEGHLIYYLNVDAPVTEGQSAIPTSGAYFVSISTSHTWSGLSAGQHKLSVQLVNNDNTPLVPAVVSSVTITSSGGGGGGGSATVFLQAHNIAFNVSTITVPAGASVTVYFSNLDSGIPHNFAVYETSAAQNLIFRGTVITGVSNITYQFTAPTTPGDYFFRCDVHPTIMTGTFVVTSDGGGGGGGGGGGSSLSAVPPEVSQYAADWALANKDYSNSRYTTDSSINAANVASLAEAWNFTIVATGTFGGAASNPLIMGDVVYFQDLYANTFALNRTTGAVVWAKYYNDTNIEGPNGPAVGYGKIFVHSSLYNLTALNLTTGAEEWTTQISYVNTTGIDIQPQIYNGMVFTSTVPGTGDVFYSPGGIGVIYALNQSNGEIIWNFTTVKDNDLWGHPDVNSGGGCWYTPSIDPNTGQIFWATGNPAPFPGAPGYPSGSSYANESLYCDCMLSLNLTTGVMSWYTQAIQHDIWDHDLQIAPILANALISGVQQDIVIGSGKGGFVYAFNRTTGSIQWVVSVGVHENDTIDPITGEMWITPAALGGVETPMAYSDGVVYVPANNLPMLFNSTSILKVDFANNTGDLVAIDVRYGHIIWQQHLPSGLYGGATVVNDLVFTATFDGMIYAFNKTTGEQVFSYQAPAGINAWPAVAGNTIIWPCGAGANSSLIALSLGGTPTSLASGKEEPVAIDLTDQSLAPNEGTQPTYPSVGNSASVLAISPMAMDIEMAQLSTNPENLAIMVDAVSSRLESAVPAKFLSDGLSLPGSDKTAIVE